MPSQPWALTAGLAITAALAGPAFAAQSRASATTVLSERPSRPGAGEGRVVFVTDKRAYLDHGTDGGLVKGQVLALSRGGRAAGTCTVEITAAHSASCSGARPRVGDTFRLTREIPPARVADRRPLPPIDEQRLRDDALAIAAAEIHLVDYAGKRRFGDRTGLALTGGYASWQASSDPQTQYRQERVDASLRIPLGQSGLRLDAAFTAIHWQPRPDTTRFRGDQPTQFYLWEAEVSRRDGDVRTVAAAGRIWLWHTPGLAMLDGVQIGRRSEDRSSEWGLYAGLLPDPLTLTPTIDAWAGGLYAAQSQAGSKGGLFRLAREEGRLGVREVPGTGLVGEGELVAQTWLAWWIVGGGGRAILVPGVRAAPALDRAFVDVRARPSTTMDAGLTVRYLGPALEAQEVLLRRITPSLQGRTHAGADARWDFLSWLGLGLRGDLSHDGDSEFAERDAAVELRLPRLFGEAGGLWLGGEAAEGWLRSRGAYAQALGQIRGRLRVLARVSAFASQYQAQSSEPSPITQELDGFLQLDAPVAGWLRLRGRALVRASLVQEAANTGPGLVFDVDAAGVF